MFAGNVFRRFRAAASAVWVATLRKSGSQDPLAFLSDDFESGTTLTGNGWLIEDTTPSSTPSDAIVSGEADLTVGGGATSGSFWFNASDGALWYRTVDGPCDMRARVRVRNGADSGLPPATSFRVAGIAAHDPDRSTYEYVHVGLGSTSIGVPAIEWKTTDNSDSAFAGLAATLTDGEMLYDLRIVRRASNTQIFDLYYRAGTSEALESDSGWTLLVTVDRTDDTVPDRASTGGSAAVAMPSSLRWGFIVYAAVPAHDLRMFVEECRFSTPTD